MRHFTLETPPTGDRRWCPDFAEKPILRLTKHTTEERVMAGLVKPSEQCIIVMKSGILTNVSWARFSEILHCSDAATVDKSAIDATKAAVKEFLLATCQVQQCLDPRRRRSLHNNYYIESGSIESDGFSVEMETIDAYSALIAKVIVHMIKKADRHDVTLEHVYGILYNVVRTSPEIGAASLLEEVRDTSIECSKTVRRVMWRH